MKSEKQLKMKKKKNKHFKQSLSIEGFLVLPYTAYSKAYRINRTASENHFMSSLLNSTSYKLNNLTTTK